LTVEDHRNRIKTAEAEREKLEVEISRDTAGYYQPSQPVTLAAVRSALPVDAALIEVAVYRPFNAALNGETAYGEPRYVAYVIRPHAEVQWKELGAVKQIDESVDAFRRGLRNPETLDVRQRARDLDRQLVQPLRPFLEGCRRLLLSPDGELSLIPFEALVDEHGRYLIKRYSFAYLTSGRDLLRMQVTRDTMSRPVVVANPLYGEPGLIPAGRRIDVRAGITHARNLGDIYFAPLSGTSEEAAGIKELFPEARLLTGTHATKKALQRVEAPLILHIATHGFFLRDSTASAALPLQPQQISGAGIENPLLRSGLALAGANHERLGNNEGILTALEASTLNLWGTKLVTLSACDTGVGTIRDRDGVYGLRRSFFLAGTESLVMSLWPVSDYVTRGMMSVYYRGLKSGLGRGEALRQAQLATLKRKGRQHPYYWASFIQSGEWANLDGKR
jgi:CHAT domain-containing protein